MIANAVLYCFRFLVQLNANTLHARRDDSNSNAGATGDAMAATNTQQITQLAGAGAPYPYAGGMLIPPQFPGGAPFAGGGQFAAPSQQFPPAMMQQCMMMMMAQMQAHSHGMPPTGHNAFLPPQPSAFPNTASAVARAVTDAATAPAAAPPPAADDLLGSLFQQSKAVQLGGSELADEQIRQQEGGSKEYNMRKTREFGQFVDFVGSHDTLSGWAKLVPSKDDPTVLHPKFIVALQGVQPKNTQAQGILNALLIEWVPTQRSKDGKRLMQPSSVATKLKKIFANLKSLNVQVGLKDLKGPGSLHAYTMVEWQKAAAVDPTFGAKPNRAPLTDKELSAICDLIRDPAFDKNLMARHVLVVSLGHYYAFRGLGDHRELTRDMVEFGKFPEGHQFAGQEWVQVGNGLLSKNNKLCMGTQPACIELPFILFLILTSAVSICLFVSQRTLLLAPTRKLKKFWWIGTTQSTRVRRCTTSSA